MQVLMGFIVFVSMIAFALFLILLVINAFKKKPVKPVLRLLLCCFGIFVVSMVIGNALYTPEQRVSFAEERLLQEQEKQREVEISEQENKENEKIEIENRVTQEQREQQTNSEQSENPSSNELTTTTPPESTGTWDNTIVILNSKLKENFIQASKEINIDISLIRNWEKTNDWVGGERYKFTYKGIPLILYANGDFTIKSINIGTEVKVYLQGFEPYNIEDFVVGNSMIERLIPLAEDCVRTALNNSSVAKFSTFGWSAGRQKEIYSLSGAVTAQNTLGLKKEMLFTVMFHYAENSTKVIFLQLDGGILLDNRESYPQQERKELENTEAESADDKLISLVDGVLGEYGKTVTLDGNEYIWYQVPRGEYRVTATSKWCKLYIDKNQTFLNSDGFTEETNVLTLELTQACQNFLCKSDFPQDKKQHKDIDLYAKSEVGSWSCLPSSQRVAVVCAA